MRLLMRRTLLIIGIIFSLHINSFSQNCIPTNINGTVINLACNQTCSTLVFRIPHIKGTGDYVLSTIPYNPYPYLSASGGESANIYADDQYGDIVDMPFPFCFYDSVFSRFTVGSNGLLTFDITNANCSNAYIIGPSIPNVGSGIQCVIAPAYYPKAAIMPAYSDLDPRTPTASPPDRKIQWHVEGSAPCRKYVISFYHIGVYGNTCGLSTPNTFQIVLHESTGIIEFFFEQKECFSSTNGGNAILGIQDWTRTKAVWYAGRNPGTWSENNTGYRFTPSGSGSRFVSSEIDDLSGNLIMPADTSTTTAGLLDLTFQNFCPPAGNNTFVVKTIFSACDNPANQLISLDTIYVNNSNALNATATSTNAGCFPTGTITVTVPNGIGTPPFSYVLDGGAPQNSGSRTYTFTNLAAGPHVVVVTDVNGCNSTINVTVGVNGSPPISNAYPSSPPCNGSNNGSIYVTVSGGIAPFTYSLDGGAPVVFNPPTTIAPLPVGTHTVLVTDGNGCSSGLMTVTITPGPPLTANVTSTATLCNGGSSGTITVAPNNGIAPFSYVLDGGAPQSGGNPYTFTNVAAGSHTIVVSDASGCTSSPITVTVAAGPPLTANVTPGATSCNGASNGTITVSPLSGVAPYSYVLDGGAPQIGGNPYTFTNVTAGSHTIIVSDAAGCVSSPISVTVPAGPPLTANVTPGATSCNGASNGTITVSPLGGAAPYSYVLDGGAPQIGGNPYTFTNVTAGSHTVVVTDASGCISSPIPVTVPAGPPLTTTVNKTDVLCFGGNTGTITVTPPSIGTPPYQYSLDGVTWQASNVFSGLIAGTYTVYYRESNGCQGSQQVTINEPTALAATSSTVPVVCNGQSNGIIAMAASGGTPGYQYSLNGGAYQSSDTFYVAAGTYTITIKDNNGCTLTKTVTVTEPTVLAANTSIQDASCDGGNDGVITVSANGGNPSYQYSLDGINFKASDTFHVAPGNYVITIKDSLGCTTTKNASVGIANNLTLTPQNDKTICEGTSVQLQLSSNATQYLWSPATGLSSTSVSNPTANPTTTTQYIVTATLGRCNANDTVIVNVNAAPIPNAGADGFICFGQSYQLNGSGGISYSWTPFNNLSSTTISNPVATPLSTTTYTLSVIDANGCRSLATDDVIVDVTPPIRVKTFPVDTILYSGDQAQLLATSAGNIYNWSPSTGLSSDTIPNPIFTAGAVGDVITYTVTASTIAGCKGLGYVTIKVYKGPDIYMPTAFTPNNDGKNDIFKPFTVGIEKINYFKIFNRWGQMVFSTERLNDGWDGKIGSAEQPSEVYVWMVQGVTKDNKIITKKGTVLLIR